MGDGRPSGRPGRDGVSHGAAHAGGHAATAVPVHAHPAGRLAGLPAPVPDDLPGPPAAAEGAAAGDLLDGGWIDQGYASGAQSAQWRESARGMVERYTATLDPSTEPLGVERTVGARTQQIVLSGRVDRLDERH